MTIIAVTGSNGQLGRRVLAQLVAKSADKVIGLVRDMTKAEASQLSAEVEFRQADYADLSSLDAALHGVQVLVLISGTDFGQRVAQHTNVLRAAKQAGVQHVIYTSLLHADSTPLKDFASEHLGTESAVLRGEGPSAWTILRNGWYWENDYGRIKGALPTGAVVGSAGGGRWSPATRDDFASAVAVVASSPGLHAGHVYELAGDHAYSFSDVAAELSRQTGKQIVYQDVPSQDFAAILEGAGVPHTLAIMLAAVDSQLSDGALLDEGRALSRLIGRPTATISEVIEGLLKDQA